jgi:hypothetical protein
MILVTDNRAPRAGLRGRTAPRHCAGEGRGGAGRARSAPLLNSLPLEWRDKGEREEGRGIGLGQEEAQWRVGGGWLRRSRLSRASRPGEPSATTRAHMARSLLRASAGGLARAGGRAGAGGLVGGRRKLRERAQCGRGPRVRALAQDARARARRLSLSNLLPGGVEGARVRLRHTRTNAER